MLSFIYNLIEHYVQVDRLGQRAQVRLGLLRHLKDSFQVVFRLETFNSSPTGEPDTDLDEELNMGANKVVATCVGVGFTNLSKRTT